MRSPVRLLAMLVAVGLIVGGVLAVQRAGRSTEVSAAEAVDAFRAAPGASDAVDRPLPGVYTYAAGGAERGSAGPLDIDRDLPDRARVVVRPTARGFNMDLHISEEHVEAVRYVRTPRGLVAVWRRVDVRFLGVGRDDRRPLAPPVLTVPADLSVGRRWDTSHRAWQLQTRSVARVTRGGVATVDGRRYRVVVIEDRGETTGAHGGPRLQRWWWSPDLQLPVRIESDVTLGGVFGYRSRMRLDLVSAVPDS